MTIIVDKPENEETKEKTEEIPVQQPKAHNYDIDSYIE